MMLKIEHDVLNKLLKHLESLGFLKCCFENGILNKFSFGPAGELIRETLKNEWIYSNVIYRENNVFTFNSHNETNLISSIRNAFLSAKTFTNGELPFSLAETSKYVTNASLSRGIMVPQQYTALTYYSFLEQTEAEQFFYRFQQERKRWWRKFSLDPGKFSFAEAEKSDETKSQTAQIVSNFPWGLHTLELVQYVGSAPFNKLAISDENIFTVRTKKKRSFPYVIISELNLDYAAFTFMCDAFSTKKGRVILKFHRKLAPFKFAFAADPGSDEDNKNLFDLAMLICLQLRKAGLSTLLPMKGEFAKKKLAIQLLRSDSLGVPYTVVLDPDTLISGIFGLYSRDTTLKEQVHVSKMAEYGQLLMKNY